MHCSLLSMVCIAAVLQASRLRFDIWDSAGKVKTMDQLWQERRAEVSDNMQTSRTHNNLTGTQPQARPACRMMS